MFINFILKKRSQYIENLMKRLKLKRKFPDSEIECEIRSDLIYLAKI